MKEEKKTNYLIYLHVQLAEKKAGPYLGIRDTIAIMTDFDGQ
jgi:hypothetical protein